jgi:hypothetical protein
MRQKKGKTLMEKMRDRKPVSAAVEWKKPKTGDFFKDFIEGNKAVIEALRKIHEEREKQQSVTRVSPS